MKYKNIFNNSRYRPKALNQRKSNHINLKIHPIQLTLASTMPNIKYFGHLKFINKKDFFLGRKKLLSSFVVTFLSTFLEIKVEFIENGYIFLSLGSFGGIECVCRLPVVVCRPKCDSTRRGTL